MSVKYTTKNLYDELDYVLEPWGDNVLIKKRRENSKLYDHVATLSPEAARNISTAIDHILQVSSGEGPQSEEEAREEGEIDALRRKLRERNEEIQSLRQYLNARNGEIGDLEETRSSLRLSLHRLKEDKKHADKRHEEEIRVLQKLVDEHKEEIRRLREVVHSLKMRTPVWKQSKPKWAENFWYEAKGEKVLSQKKAAEKNEQIEALRQERDDLKDTIERLCAFIAGKEND